MTKGNEHADGLLLPGLDGSNPLGFLAALGLFRVVADREPSPSRLHWEASHGTWVPRLQHVVQSDSELLDLLETRLHTSISEHPIRMLEWLNDDDAAARSTRIRDAVNACTAADRNEVDWIASLASDVIPPAAINQLQTTRRDYHYGNLTAVIERTTRSHLVRTLFEPWDYADGLDNQSLHLDPSEDRRHAHQWNKPAGDPNRKNAGGMLGANRLAIEAFPVFVSVPHQDALHTLGFTGQRSYDTRWTWPIWTHPVTFLQLRSLLAIREIQGETIDLDSIKKLRARGIVAAFRTRRILVGKTPNFTPPVCVA